MSTNNVIYIIHEVSRALKSEGFKNIHTKQERVSEGKLGYTVYEEKETHTDLYVVRISNHICALHNFSDHYKKPLNANDNAKQMRRMGKNIQKQYKPIHFYSIVFKEFDIPRNDNAAWNLTCHEYVFDPDSINNGSNDALLNSISQEIISLLGTQNSQDTPTAICGVSPTIRQKTNNNNNLQEHTIYNKNKIKIRNNMKRRIRLTEGKLRRLVESALNEISWNTAYNAGKKRWDRNEVDKADRDFDFARDKFAKQYGLNPDNVSMHNGYGWFKGDDGWSYDVNTDYCSGGWYNHDKFDSIEDAAEADPDMENGDWGNTHEAFWGPSGKDSDAFYDLEGQIHGWNESRRRMANAITESVIRRLRRR